MLHTYRGCLLAQFLAAALYADQGRHVAVLMVVMHHCFLSQGQYVNVEASLILQKVYHADSQLLSLRRLLAAHQWLITACMPKVGEACTAESGDILGQCKKVHEEVTRTCHKVWRALQAACSFTILQLADGCYFRASAPAKHWQPHLLARMISKYTMNMLHGQMDRETDPSQLKNCWSVARSADCSSNCSAVSANSRASCWRL